MSIEAFVDRWYGKSFEQMCSTFSLIPYNRCELESAGQKCSLLSNNRVLGSTFILSDFIKSSNIISGGPCIDDSHYDVSLESFFEIVSLIKVGKVLNKKVIIHVGVGEEILREDQSEDSVKKWISIGDRYEKIIEQMKKVFNYSEVFCCRSDKKEVDEKIIFYANELKKIFSPEDAKTLYQHLSSNGKPVQKDSFNFDIHTRFLALYLPEFIESVFGISDAKLLVYEDLQQVMAAKKGNAFAVLRNHFNAGPIQIITLPFPAPDGKSRMHRFDRAKRPYLHSEESLIFELCKNMPSEVLDYNLNNWPQELTKGKINDADSLAKFFCTLKEYDACD